MKTSKTAASTVTALSPTEIEAKLAAIKEFNNSALELLQSLLKPRWPALVKQAAEQDVSGDHLAALCGKMLRTRREWTHLPNFAARELAAAHGLLLALGSNVTAADEAQLDALSKSV